MNCEISWFPSGDLGTPAPPTPPHPQLAVVTSSTTHASGGVSCEELAQAAWRSDGDEIWQAWRGLADWEEQVDARFDLSFGRHLLVLWALYTFRGGPQDVIGELVADDLEPQFGDPIIEDMVRTAFALGASWAAAQQQQPDGATPAAGGPEKPHLRVASRQF